MFIYFHNQNLRVEMYKSGNHVILFWSADIYAEVVIIVYFTIYM